MKPGNINRRPLVNSPMFAMRGDSVKWPTLRKGWLTDASVEEIEQYVTGTGRSIIFLDGTYRTNLNQWCDPPRGPWERAVFFEFLVKHPRVKGGIYILSWIGNYHNGSIIHFGLQYPQVRCWHEVGNGVEEFFEKKTFQVYKTIAHILYKNTSGEMDDEVRSFIKHNS